VMSAVVEVESSFNPLAIGVVGNRLVRQPRTLEEAVATANELKRTGHNFSVGLAQINQSNFKKYGLHSVELAFDTCTNLKTGASILNECYQRSGNDWLKAFSCYYSGNFTTGFRHGYVDKVKRVIEKNTGGKPMAVAQESARKHAEGAASADKSASSYGADETLTLKSTPLLHLQRKGESSKNSPEFKDDSAFVF
jgi:type IV secretion system protein VirB1